MPTALYDDEGLSTWRVELDAYGKARLNTGSSLTECPFRYQGQYEDVETGLYYNRFRYYAPEEGIYISQDPIGLESGEPNFYAYVHDTNTWIDPLGLNGGSTSFIGDALHPKTVTPNNPGGVYTIKATGTYQGDKGALFGAAKIKGSFSDHSDYIAHHISYDPETNTMKMQLVKESVHSKVSHVGGVKDYREKHNGIGYEQSKKKTKVSCKS